MMQREGRKGRRMGRIMKNREVAAMHGIQRKEWKVGEKWDSFEKGGRVGLATTFHWEYQGAHSSWFSYYSGRISWKKNCFNVKKRKRWGSGGFYINISCNRGVDVLSFSLRISLAEPFIWTFIVWLSYGAKARLG